MEQFTILNQKETYTHNEVVEILSQHYKHNEKHLKTKWEETILKPVQDKINEFNNNKLKERLLDKVDNNWINEFISNSQITNDLSDDEIIKKLNTDEFKKYKKETTDSTINKFGTEINKKADNQQNNENFVPVIDGVEVC